MERRGFLTRLAGAAALTTIGAAVGTSSASAAVAQSTPVGAIPTWMYVQTGRSGSWRRKGSGYELTIEGVAPNIVAFTDRPSRNVQTQSLKTWLSKFPILGKKNPPNAAVVVPDGKGGEKTLIVELTKGAYDPTKQRATWLVRPLREQVTGHKAGVAKRLGIDVRDYSLPSSFTTPSLLIDGCPRTWTNKGTSTGNGQGQPCCWIIPNCVWPSGSNAGQPSGTMTPGCSRCRTSKGSLLIPTMQLTPNAPPG